MSGKRLGWRNGISNGWLNGALIAEGVVVVGLGFASLYNFISVDQSNQVRLPERQKPGIERVVEGENKTSSKEREYTLYHNPNPEINSNLIYARYTGKWEGKKNKVYDPIPWDGKYEPTIGIGHLMDNAHSRKTFAKVLPEVNYNDALNGRISLTNEQVNRLFAHDIQTYVDKARKAFPKFDSYSQDLRKALVDGYFRGDLSGSPNTRKLINEGKFQAASKEYLNNYEYLHARELGRPGIIPRMNKNSEAMLKYAMETEK